MTTKASRIRFLEIAGAPSLTTYSKVIDVDASSEDYLTIIDRAVSARAVPGGTEIHGLHDGLDLDLGRSSGIMAFVFRLTDTVGLDFQAPPLVALPSNFDTPEVYLDNILSHGNDNRWASFTCDFDAVRTSKLAVQISSRVPKVTAITIPFMLNIVDHQLGCAPWMVPAKHDDDTAAGLLGIKTHGGAHPQKMMTHGGAHPQFASYLTVDFV